MPVVAAMNGANPKWVENRHCQLMAGMGRKKTLAMQSGKLAGPLHPRQDGSSDGYGGIHCAGAAHQQSKHNCHCQQDRYVAHQVALHHRIAQ